MQRCDRNEQLIDGCCVNLSHVDTHAVVTGLLNTGNAGRRFAGLHTGLVFSAQFGNCPGLAAAPGGLSSFSLFHSIVCGYDGIPEILGSGVIGKFKAPVGSTGSYRIGGSIIAVADAVINDFLSKVSAGVIVVIIPESIVLLLGKEIICLIAIRTGSKNDVSTAVHAGAIGLHAFNGQRIEGGGPVISWVGEDIERKDHIIDCDRLTVRENQIFAKLDVEIDSFVIVDGDF